MKCVSSIVLGSEPNPAAPLGLVVRATILSADTPASLEITGADVDGLGDADIIAAGSVLITPSKNYLAFEDGVFTEVENSGGSNITLGALNATDNGTYTPETGHAYNSVVVAVPTAVGVNF